MKRLYHLLRLLRPQQWYKNLLIFLAIIFSNNLFNSNLLKLTLIGFVALCSVSSANYIINDIKDIKRDRLNPEKKNRPLASNKISKFEAILTAIILLALSIYLAKNFNFLLIIGILFVLTQFYTFGLQNIIFLDVILISINFLLRAISGALIINVEISPWLVLGVFFFAFFLAVGKRYSEFLFLKNKYRKVLKEYDKKTLNSLLIISTTLLLICFSLFTFLSEHNNLVWTTPLFLFLVLRYYYLIKKGSSIARNPIKAIADKQLAIGSFALTITFFIILYVL